MGGTRRTHSFWRLVFQRWYTSEGHVARQLVFCREPEKVAGQSVCKAQYGLARENIAWAAFAWRIGMADCIRSIRMD